MKTEEEIKDLIECIAKFDSTETLENKGKYFEVIQKDATRLFAMGNVNGYFDTDNIQRVVNFFSGKHIEKKYIIEVLNTGNTDGSFCPRCRGTIIAEKHNKTRSKCITCGHEWAT